jgi:hypothetical protein
MNNLIQFFVISVLYQQPEGQLQMGMYKSRCFKQNFTTLCERLNEIQNGYILLRSSSNDFDPQVK